MRRRGLHPQDMPTSTPRPRRRYTLVPLDLSALSEGVLVVDADRIVLEVAGGPPLVELGVFAADQLIGSVELDHLGAGSVAMIVPLAAGHGSTSIALRHDGCTVLKGCLADHRAFSAAGGGQA